MGAKEKDRNNRVRVLLVITLFLGGCGLGGMIAPNPYREHIEAALRRHRGELLWPLDRQHQRITSNFGKRRWSFHEGTDIAAPGGSPVYAAHSGTVVSSGYVHGYGNIIVIRGDGLLTVYGHNKKNLVRKGRRVGKGQKIALVGSTGNATGNHLHFEVRPRVPGGRWAAVDPLAFY